MLYSVCYVVYPKYTTRHSKDTLVKLQYDDDKQ